LRARSTPWQHPSFLRSACAGAPTRYTAPFFVVLGARAFLPSDRFNLMQWSGKDGSGDVYRICASCA
jgi:hypothetical protein